MFKEFLWVLLFWTTSVYCIFENCDYYQKLEFNKTYSIFSPGYPNKYPPGNVSVNNCFFFL